MTDTTEPDPVPLRVDDLWPDATAIVWNTDPQSEEWQVARVAGIGASDLPAILGLSQYRGPGHVWADKLGLLDREPDSEPALWGRILEEPVAREWATRNSVTLYPAPLLQSKRTGWALATPDRRVAGCPHGSPCGYEGKTRNAFVAGKWSLTIPDDVLAQVQWQMYVTGWTHVHVAALIGGQCLEDYTIWRDDDVIALLLRAATSMWEHIESRVQPDEANARLLLDLLAKLNPDPAGVRVLAEDETLAAREALAYLEAAKALKKQCEDDVETFRARLFELAGDAHYVTGFDDVPLFERKKVKGRSGWDSKKLRKEYPEAAAACATTGDPSYRLVPITINDQGESDELN